MLLDHYPWSLPQGQLIVGLLILGLSIIKYPIDISVNNMINISNDGGCFIQEKHKRGDDSRPRCDDFNHFREGVKHRILNFGQSLDSLDDIFWI